LLDRPSIRLLYRPHPNRSNPIVPQGFQLLLNLDEINGIPGTVFASFYSTCQIDPSFKGTKVLIRGHLIYPEIVFDQNESILNLDGLIEFINNVMLQHQGIHALPSPSRANSSLPRSRVDIPLLCESYGYAARLIEASRRFGDVKYQFHRRVNWTQRYDEKFYELEAACFLSDPEAYLAQQQCVAPQVSDVFAQKLHLRQVVTVLMKVSAHWLFRVLGSVANRGIRLSGASIYRKCYVDDIELVFDPEELGVVRAVYPFPLNTGRQLRYVRFLLDKGYRFKLAGNPYLMMDLVRFLVRRDVRSLKCMESRAQVRHAGQVAEQGFKTVQLSDEFDIGSLDFARTLARLSVHVINSAHGVGKYFPMHAYQEFHVITERQTQYYHAVRPCRYTLRMLNDRTALPSQSTGSTNTPGINFVFLSQVFEGVTNVIASNEAFVLKRLNAEFAGSPSIRLLYRPHPNRSNPIVPQGFQLLLNLDEINGIPGTVFASFYSTCQIDPSFKGTKVLIRGHLIYPEIVFDQNESILNSDGLINLLCNLIHKLN
jgi:hypothetical protein